MERIAKIRHGSAVGDLCAGAAAVLPSTARGKAAIECADGQAGGISEEEEV